MIRGWANGCFDALHAGHRHFLAECRKQCDTLVVGLNFDYSVRALKGKDRPIFNKWKRSTDLLATGMVDEVEFIGRNLRMTVRRRRPGIVFRGWDQTIERWLAPYRVMVIPRFETWSTTAEIEKRRA